MCYPGATLIGTRKGSEGDSLVFVAESEPVYVPSASGAGLKVSRMFSTDIFGPRSPEPSIVGKPSIGSNGESVPAVTNVSSNGDSQEDMIRVRSKKGTHEYDPAKRRKHFSHDRLSFRYFPPHQ